MADTRASLRKKRFQKSVKARKINHLRTFSFLNISKTLTVDGEPIKLCTKCYTLPEKWFVEGSHMKGSSGEAKLVLSLTH